MTPSASVSIPSLKNPRVLESFKRLGLIDEDAFTPTAPVVITSPIAAPTAQPGELDEDRDLGPPIPGYIEPPWTKFVCDIMLSMSHFRGGVVLRGMPGTSKTTSVKHVVRVLRRAGHKVELFNCQAFDGMAIEDLRGTWTIQDGKSDFVYGPVAAAVIFSHANPDTIVIIQCEEANMARPGVWSWLNTVCDGSGDRIAMPNGESVSPTLGRIKLAMCYNEGPDFAGTREINRAMIDRLSVVDTDYLTPRDEAKAIHAVTGLPMDGCKRIVGVARIIRGRVADHGYILSPRALLCWAHLRQIGYGWMEAFDLEIVPRVGGPGTIPGEQRETIRQIAKVEGVEKWP